MQVPVSWPFGTRTSVTATDHNISNMSLRAWWEKKKPGKETALMCPSCVLHLFPTCSVLFSSWPSCFCDTGAMLSPKQVGKEAVTLRQCVLQNVCQGKDSQKNIPKARRLVERFIYNIWCTESSALGKTLIPCPASCIIQRLSSFCHLINCKGNMLLGKWITSTINILKRPRHHQSQWSHVSLCQRESGLSSAKTNAEIKWLLKKIPKDCILLMFPLEAPAISQSGGQKAKCLNSLLYCY